MHSGKRLYWTLALLSVGGYAWIAFQVFATHAHVEGLTLCLFKNVTGFPCPSCGVTRSLLMFISADFQKGFLLNPLGLIVGVAMLIVPLWMIMDGLMHKKTFAEFFFSTEQKFKTKKIFYIPALTLILLNWCWNIMKDLT